MRLPQPVRIAVRASAHTARGCWSSLEAISRNHQGVIFIDNLDRLAALIRRERGSLLIQWRQQVEKLSSARHLDAPTLNDHIPQLIEELAVALEARSVETIAAALNAASPPAHGAQRLHDGFDIEEVVAEYNILRGCIHDLAEANGLVLQGRSFHILNRVLDGSIGLAVQTFSAQRALEVRQSRDEYLEFVAHDLRTPLSAILLAAGVLQRALPEHDANAAQARMFKTLIRNVMHLDELVDKIIEENGSIPSEPGAPLVRRTFDLWPLVEALVRELDSLARGNGTRLVNAVPDDLVVFADASMLRRILQNLVANAIVYTPSGEVVIAARDDVAPGVVALRVSDNGAGIAPERLPQVFDKNETDPEKEGGLGLGLAIVKAFVEAHHGKVSVASTPGQGSTFGFTLPRAQGTVAAQVVPNLHERDAELQAPGRAGKNVPAQNDTQRDVERVVPGRRLWSRHPIF